MAIPRSNCFDYELIVSSAPGGQTSTAQGIPKNSAVKYEASIKAGKFVLVAHGTAEEVAKARDMLKTSGAEQIESYETSTEVARVA